LKSKAAAKEINVNIKGKKDQQKTKRRQRTRLYIESANTTEKQFILDTEGGEKKQAKNSRLRAQSETRKT